MNPNEFEFNVYKHYYTIKNNLFVNEGACKLDDELTTEQFIELFDKKETELDKWLKETKAKNLSEIEIYKLLFSQKECPDNIYIDLKNKFSVNSQKELSEFLFNQWNNPTEESPKVETEWQPKRGDRVLVWDSEGNDLKERIFLIKIESAIYPIITVGIKYGNEFNNGEKFGIECYKHMKPLPIEQPKKDKVAEVAYQYCKKLGINNTSYSVDIIQSFINGAKWQLEQPKETDFKSKVIELIEKRITICIESIEEYKKLNSFSACEIWRNCKHENQELLKQIKEL
jgi:hypothetical protein